MKRIPRPIGTTEMASNYNRTNDEEHYQSLKQIIIHHYLRNNFSYCGRYMNIETFANLIKETPISIQKYMASYGKALSDLNDELTNKDMFRVLSNSVFNFCLEDRSLAHQQLSLLLQSQGSSYAPFISGEVNKAIKLMMDANTNTQQFMRTMLGNSGTMNTLPYGAPEQGTTEKGVTIDDAIMLLKENAITPLLSDSQGKDNLYKEYNIQEMPEVNALKQIGVDASKEGLSINDITKMPLNMVNHENRREEEYGIIDNDDI